jgi:peptide chain release factor 2
MHEKDFWNDPQKAAKISQKLNRLKKVVDEWQTFTREADDFEGLLDLYNKEGKNIEGDVERELESLAERIDSFELTHFFTDEDDARDAILTIHPGAGGTESQDWAEMLLRMYTMWAQERDYEVKLLDLQSGEEAGIKSASLEVKGEYAYGYLKSERGVHRLVRISPFDANARRHTSFASVFIYPEIDSDIVIEIDEKDLRIETYRASGAGGQHVNKTDSAVRITHIPTGIVAQSQNERSQHRNKENVFKILRARLYENERQKELAKKEKIEQEKKDISWGNQIRSYVFHPYTLVKDHRTGVETGDVQGVMAGKIDRFLQAFLRGSTHPRKAGA